MSEPNDRPEVRRAIEEMERASVEPPAPAQPQHFEHAAAGFQTKVSIYPPGQAAQPQQGTHVRVAPPPASGQAGQGGTVVRMYPAGTGPQPGSQTAALDAQEGQVQGMAIVPEVLPMRGTKPALEMLCAKLEAELPRIRELLANPRHRGTGAERCGELVSLWDELYSAEHREEPGILVLLQRLAYLRKILDRSKFGAL